VSVQNTWEQIYEPLVFELCQANGDFSFSNTILLRCISTRILMNYIMKNTIILKSMLHIF